MLSFRIRAREPHAEVTEELARTGGDRDRYPKLLSLLRIDVYYITVLHATSYLSASLFVSLLTCLPPHQESVPGGFS